MEILTTRKSYKNYIHLLLIAAAGVLFLLISNYSPKETVYINSIPLKVEIADTSAEHAKGLMYRKSLDESSGMLFKFTNSSIHYFWMRNTKIPLDMIWVDSNNKIVAITKDAQPCPDNELKCPMYSSNGIPVQYVIEVNAGWADRHAISIGDTVSL